MTWGEPGWPDVVAFVESATDPIDDLLVWADVRSALGRLATIWLARVDLQPVGVAFAFPLWPELPSLGLVGLTPAIEDAMVAELVRMGAWRRGYMICKPRQRALFAAHGEVGTNAPEVHLTLAAAAWQTQRDTPPSSECVIRPATLPELDAFYHDVGAAAWNPVQFATGPYVVAEVEGRIVAAAGTHFAYEHLAQVGNVFTASRARGRGLARRCTAAVVDALVAQGHGTISLFVGEDNAPARAVYGRLGFTEHQNLAAFAWQVIGEP